MLVVVRDIRDGDFVGLVDVFRSSSFDFPWGFYFNVDESVFGADVLRYFRVVSDKSRSLVGVVDGRVVGFGDGFPSWDEDDNFYIALLVVHRDFRGLGVGGALIREFVRHAVASGFGLVSLNTWASNRAMRLYERFGFVWVPGSAVYMVNFAPQLWRYGFFRELFGDPGCLVDCLVSKPERVLVGRRVLWRYVWRVGDRLVEVVFDNDSRLPVSVKSGEFFVEVVVPEDRVFLKGDKVRVVVRSSERLSVFFGGEFLGVVDGEKVFDVDVREKMEFFVGSFKLGFKLRVREPLEVGFAGEPFSFGFCDVVLVNRRGEPVRGVLRFHSNSVKVSPSRFDVNVPGGGSSVFRVFLNGCGKVFVSLGDFKKELIVPCSSGRWIEKDSLRVGGWVVSKRNIRLTGSDWLLTFKAVLGGREVDFVLDKESGLFKGNVEGVTVLMKPELENGVLSLKVDFFGEPGSRRDFRLFYYFDSPSDVFFLLPNRSGVLARGRDFYPFFPKMFGLFRKSLPYNVFGFEGENFEVLIGSDRVFLYSFRYAPFHGVMEFSVDLGSDGRDSFEISIFSSGGRGSPERFKRDLVAVEEVPGGVRIENNWINTLNLSLFALDKKFDVELESGENVYLNILDDNEVPPVESEVKIRFEGVLEKKKLLLTPAKSAFKDKVFRTNNVEMVLTSKGGTVKTWRIGGSDVLVWSEAPMRSPTSIPISHGGIALLLIVDNEELNLSVIDWEPVKDGVFRYFDDRNDIEVLRHWFPSSKKVIEFIEISNRSNELRDIRGYWVIFLNGEIRRIDNGDSEVSDGPFLFLEGKNIELSTDKFSMRISNKKYNVEIAKLSKGFNFARLRWKRKMKPGEKIVVMNTLEVSGNSG